DHVHAELEGPLVVRGRERAVDHRLDPVAPADRREAVEVEDAVVRVRRRLAHQHTRGGPDRVLERLVVTGRYRRPRDAVAVQRLVQELPGAPVAVVGDHDVGAAREHGEERRRHRGHAAREQESGLGALECGQLGLGDLLRRVAVAAVLDAVDLAVEVVLQLLRVGERVRRGLHDRRGERVPGRRPRLAPVDGERARADERFLRVGGAALAAALPVPAARGHHGTRRRARSTWRAIARATCAGSGGSSTGVLRWDGRTPSMAPMGYAAFWSANLSPFAVEITTTRSWERITLRSTSLRRAARATPVCGQLNMPVRSARAASSASSCSEACSTTPLNRCSVRMARLMLTGLPIWMAIASVGCAVTGSKCQWSRK